MTSTQPTLTDMLGPTNTNTKYIGCQVDAHIEFNSSRDPRPKAEFTVRDADNDHHTIQIHLTSDYTVTIDYIMNPDTQIQPPEATSNNGYTDAAKTVTKLITDAEHVIPADIVRTATRLKQLGYWLDDQEIRTCDDITRLYGHNPLRPTARDYVHVELDTGIHLFSDAIVGIESSLSSPEKLREQIRNRITNGWLSQINSHAEAHIDDPYDYIENSISTITHAGSLDDALALRRSGEQVTNTDSDDVSTDDTDDVVQVQLSTHR